MAQRRRGSLGPSGYVLGFELRPGHILEVAAPASLLLGQVQLIQAVALLRTNGATDVVVYLIDRASGRVCERVAVAKAQRLGMLTEGTAGQPATPPRSDE